MLHVDDQLAGQVALGAADVVLAKKGRHDFGDIFLNTYLREKILAAQHTPAAHVDQVHTGAARVDESGNHVHVAVTALHALLVLNPAQQGNLVTHLSGTLEVQRAGSLFHGCVQLIGQGTATPFKEHDRMAYVLGIFLRVNQADARRLATLDLVLQARSRSVFEVAVVALTHQKSLLQDTQTFTDGAGAGVRPEILAFQFFGTAVNTQPRVLTIRQKHIGVGLVVAQQDVVRRTPLFDKRLLKQQRFGFVGGNSGFNLRDTRNQCSRLGRQAGFAKIAGQAFFQVLGLAHIEKPRIAVEHAIHAGSTTAGRKKCTCIKHVCHL